MSINIEDTLAPDSTQLDAVDLLGGPRTFTVQSVSKVEADQPVHIKLVEFPRLWKPGKSMRRVLASCWGKDASQWAGHRVTLYCDESVRFGNDRVGGTRISHLSHIDTAKSIPLLVSRGKSAMFKVEALKETDEQKKAAFKDAWKLTTDPAVRAAIEAEVAALDARPDVASGGES
jgi:hypothetical protein